MTTLGAFNALQCTFHSIAVPAGGAAACVSLVVHAVGDDAGTPFALAGGRVQPVLLFTQFTPANPVLPRVGAVRWLSALQQAKLGHWRAERQEQTRINAAAALAGQCGLKP